MEISIKSGVSPAELQRVKDACERFQKMRPHILYIEPEDGYIAVVGNRCISKGVRPKEYEAEQALKEYLTNMIGDNGDGEVKVKIEFTYYGTAVEVLNQNTCLMIADYDPYYIMPADVEVRVHGALLQAIEMAKASYPHLVEQLQFAEKRYTDTLESFIGTQNKPATKKAYSTK